MSAGVDGGISKLAGCKVDLLSTAVTSGSAVTCVDAITVCTACSLCNGVEGRCTDSRFLLFAEERVPPLWRSFRPE